MTVPVVVHSPVTEEKAKPPVPVDLSSLVLKVVRLPFFDAFRNSKKVAFQGVNVESLNGFNDGATVDLVALYDAKLISHKERPIKILGNGELTKKLTVKANAFSASAKVKIEKMGGVVVL